MNELAKRAYWDYKRMSQKEEKLLKELIKAANEVVESKNAEEQDTAYEEMCIIRNELDTVAGEVNMLARIALDNLSEDLFE